MSHFTTGTSSFILSKYSRSYPVKRPVPKVQFPSQCGPEFSSDWQHFTNPVIRLVLDVKTSSDSEMESVKLRILWEINHGIETCTDSQNVIFEDLDLLSFSVLPFGPQRKDQLEGLPLKAVYRDTVVGIRYLHSREEGTNVPIYRRFQISFQIPSEASEFIQTIKPICPCKLNPNSIPGRALSQLHTLAIRPQSTAATSLAPPNCTSSYACPPPSLPSTKQKTSIRQRATSVFPRQSVSSPLAIHSSSATSSYFLAMEAQSTDQTLGGSSMSHLLAPSSASDSVHNSTQFTELYQHGQTSAKSSVINLSASSLPNSSLSSSSNSTIMSSLAVRGGHSCDPIQPSQAISTIISALEESMSIYSLPTCEVERILSEVLHEEGFVQLVERISGMLMVQTLLDT